MSKQAVHDSFYYSDGTTPVSCERCDMYNTDDNRHPERCDKKSSNGWSAAWGKVVWLLVGKALRRDYNGTGDSDV